jgi:hypothetical protein
VFSANGDTWKRHRRIMAPAFTTSTSVYPFEYLRIHSFFFAARYSLIVSETIALYNALVTAEGWQGQDEASIADNHIFHKVSESLIMVPRSFQLTYGQLTLVLIARCGFGIRLPWTDSTETRMGSMSFAAALGKVTHTAIARLVLPPWAYKLPIKRFGRSSSF